MKEKIKGFFKKIGEGIKKVAGKVMEFFRGNGKKIVKTVSSFGVATVMWGIATVLYKNHALCEALGLNLGPVGTLIGLCGVAGLSLCLQHAVSKYVEDEMDDIFAAIDGEMMDDFFDEEGAKA